MSARRLRAEAFPALLSAALLWPILGVLAGPYRDHGGSIVPPNDLPSLPGYRAVWERGPLDTLVRPDDVYLELVQVQPGPFVGLDFRVERQLRFAVAQSPLVVVAAVDAIEPRRQFPRFQAAVVHARVERVLKNALPRTIVGGDAIEFTLHAIDEQRIGKTRLVRRAHYERVPEAGRIYLWCLFGSREGLGGDTYGFAFEIRGQRAIPMFQDESAPLQPLRAEHALRIANAAAGRHGLGIRAGIDEVGRWPSAR